MSSSRTAGEGHTRRKAGPQSHGTQGAGSAELPRRALPNRKAAQGDKTTCAAHRFRPGRTAMLARIRKAQEEREGGFTLIELLVVMIIIGILAAIAIPVFLNQRKKAQDSAAKADVSTLGKEIATYYVDNTNTPVISVPAGSGRYSLTDGATPKYG